MGLVAVIDFDGTVVREDDHAFDDLSAPLRLMPGAREGLRALRRAGHALVLWSRRASLALRNGDPALDPLVQALVRPGRPDGRASLHEARYRQMVAFVERELPGVFAYVYRGGEIDKPAADLFIDNLAIRLGDGVGGLAWRRIAALYGEPGAKPLARIAPAKRRTP